MLLLQIVFKERFGIYPIFAGTDIGIPFHLHRHQFKKAAHSIFEMWKIERSDFRSVGPSIEVAPLSSKMYAHFQNLAVSPGSGRGGLTGNPSEQEAFDKFGLGQHHPVGIEVAEKDLSLDVVFNCAARVSLSRVWC